MPKNRRNKTRQKNKIISLKDTFFVSRYLRDIAKNCIKSFRIDFFSSIQFYDVIKKQKGFNITELTRCLWNNYEVS